jgi:hypothetical protein
MFYYKETWSDKATGMTCTYSIPYEPEQQELIKWIFDELKNVNGDKAVKLYKVFENMKGREEKNGY